MTSATGRDLLDTSVDIETPEHVSFHYRVAGPARRAIAYALDLLVRVALLAAAALVAGLVGSSAPQALAGAGMGVLLLLAFLVEWTYFVACELLMAGQSVGKRALHLRVVHEDGTAVSWGDSILRNLLRGADFLPAAYALGVVVMARDRAFRRLGDVVAGTLVVHEATSRLPVPIDLSELPAWRFDSAVELSPAELEALEAFVRRRQTLSAPRLRELAMLLAQPLAHRHGLAYDDPADLLLSLYRQAIEARA